MPLRDVCQRNVVCINPQTTIHEAAKLMKEKHVGDLVVIDAHAIPPRPVGMITDRDIVTMVVAADVQPTEVLVEDIMARQIRVVHQDEGVYELTLKMREAGVRRMPVVDDNGGLVGVVSIDDVYKLLSSEFGNLAAVSAFQLANEVQGGALASRF